jgi:hypothetical protein
LFFFDCGIVSSPLHHIVAARASGTLDTRLRAGDVSVKSTRRRSGDPVTGYPA